MKILLIDPFPDSMVADLRSTGHEVAFLPDIVPADVYSVASDAHVIIMNSKVNADAKLLAAAPMVKMICRAGVGMDHFDLPLLESKGILAVNTPGANAVPVGEQALGMLLALMHNICRADRQVRDFQWRREENRATELKGKTVGVIGFGNTGSNFARCLSGFGCRILAYDKYKTGFAPDYVLESTLEQIFDEADVVSFHVPLTPETDNWATSGFFARFVKPIWLLNLSRGPVVRLQPLLDAIQSGKVIAAGLDVLENENMLKLSEAQRLTMEALMATDRVIFTPHIGGWSHESLKRINDKIVEEVREFLRKGQD